MLVCRTPSIVLSWHIGRAICSLKSSTRGCGCGSRTSPRSRGNHFIGLSLQRHASSLRSLLLQLELYGGLRCSDPFGNPLVGQPSSRGRSASASCSFDKPWRLTLPPCLRRRLRTALFDRPYSAIRSVEGVPALYFATSSFKADSPRRASTFRTFVTPARGRCPPRNHAESRIPGLSASLRSRSVDARLRRRRTSRTP